MASNYHGPKPAVDGRGRRDVASQATTKDELKAIRTRLGITQRELARRIGVVPKTVARWEAGVHRIDPIYERLVLIAAKAVEIGKAEPEAREQEP